MEINRISNTESKIDNNIASDNIDTIITSYNREIARLTLYRDVYTILKLANLSTVIVLDHTTHAQLIRTLDWFVTVECKVKIRGEARINNKKERVSKWSIHVIDYAKTSLIYYPSFIYHEIEQCLDKVSWQINTFKSIVVASHDFDAIQVTTKDNKIKLTVISTAEIDTLFSKAKEKLTNLAKK